MIKQLNSDELLMVHGGGEGAQGFGYVVGRVVGGVMYVGGAIADGTFGSWLGGAVYDVLH